MMIVSWVDSGRIITDRLTDREAADLIRTLRALDITYAASHIPEGSHAGT